MSKERPRDRINADVFKQTFGIYATELWSMSESQFLEWLNSEYDCEGQTMRLIDADKLIPDRDLYEGQGYSAVSCEQIDNAPTVAIVYTGEWLVGDFGEHYCSNCKHYALDRGSVFRDEILTDRCPYCGAYMRGGRQ